VAVRPSRNSRIGGEIRSYLSNYCEWHGDFVREECLHFISRTPKRVSSVQWSLFHQKTAEVRRTDLERCWEFSHFMEQELVSAIIYSPPLCHSLLRSLGSVDPFPGIDLYNFFAASELITYLVPVNLHPIDFPEARLHVLISHAITHWNIPRIPVERVDMKPIFLRSPTQFTNQVGEVFQLVNRQVFLLLS
jgi:hypothetical protein